MNDLPILLDAMDVASPCTADWEAMDGNDTVRFCGECRKNVYNLSHMTRREAEQVVREHEGHVCVRFYRRHDGTLLTRDCPVGLRAIRRRIARRLAGVAAMIGAILWGRVGNPLAAGGDEPPKQPAGNQHPGPALIMGEICPPPNILHPPVMGKMVPPKPAVAPKGWDKATAVTVSAKQNWVKTPISVPDGGQIELRLDPHFKNVWSSSPTVKNVSGEGAVNIIAPEGYCLPGRADGCLVARIADVRHYIGQGTLLAPRKGGVVYLSINDDEENQRGEGFKDNEGELHVLIRVVEK